MDIRYSSDMTVELIESSADDANIVRAARVSTLGDRSKLPPEDESAGLINFLMRERHGSPFEHAVFTFYVKAPIFVWREHMRHRVASYNEESGRYKVLEPEFYVPDADRKLVQIGKTGEYSFVEGTDAQYAITTGSIKTASKTGYQSYLHMLEAGVAKEVARMALPVNIYSSAYVTMNARALMNFLSLRQSSETSHFPSYPQREIEMVAEQYEYFFSQAMPLTHEAFIRNGRVAP